MANPLAGLPAVLGLTFLLFAGCAVDKGGPEADGWDGGLPVGHYLIDEEKDGELGNETWLVVLPDSTWEMVDYFISYGNKVCGIGRTRGTYTMDENSIALIALEEAVGPDNCPITQADFDGVTWEAVAADEAFVLDIRNLTSSSFQASGGFLGPGWRPFIKQDDPHGYYD